MNFLHVLVSQLLDRFPALTVLDSANMLAKSFIFHGQEEVEFLVTHFVVDLTDLTKGFEVTVYMQHF